MTERAQSEMVGFVLIFGVMLLLILLITATGFVGLHSAQEHHRTSNIQPAFELLSDNVDDIVHHGAPSRATEIKVRHASIAMESTLEITVENGNDSTTFTTQSIAYTSEPGTGYRYENGLVLRTDDGGSVLVREPNLEITDDTIVLPIVELQPAGTARVGGSATVLVQLRHNESALIDEEFDNVTIKVNSADPEVWEEFLAAEASEHCDVKGTTVECESTRVYIPVHRIGVSFE